ncbi:MAG: 1-(5-phosphoribosyl)-5-[(5-phosphoribosylamino)methylideneamino]imidazole-4-carboxamide isomerase [Blastocatellia bacterium]
MIVIPAIDLRGGRTVRLVEGAADRETRYDLDPVEVAKGFERDGAELLHLVDLDGAFDGLGGSANADVVLAILETVGIPVELGGGLRSEASVEVALGSGARWAILGTAAVEDFSLVRSLAGRFPGRIVVGIDARDGRVATRGWTDVTGVDAVELGRRVRDAGVERVIYTDIARDGKLQGPNLEATLRFAEETGLDVTVSGGVSSIEDVRTIAAATTLHSCIIGKAIYEGRLTLSEAVAAANSIVP